LRRGIYPSKEKGRLPVLPGANVFPVPFLYQHPSRWSTLRRR
jgi:hypothetical protein